MRIRIEFSRPYRAMRCTFCNATLHQGRRGWPSWVSELVGRYRFWRHARSAEHRHNRPSGELAPAPVLDPEAFAAACERRVGGGGGLW